MKLLSEEIEKQAYELIREAGYHPDFWVCQCMEFPFVHPTSELKCDICKNRYPGNGNATPEEVEDWAEMMLEPIYTCDAAIGELAKRVFTEELESLEAEHE